MPLLKKPSFFGLVAAIISIVLWILINFFNPYSNELNNDTTALTLYFLVFPAITAAKTSLLPEDIAMGFLADTTKWQITGTENVAGVNSVIIKGVLNDYYSTKYRAKNFKLNVDPNTGILLQMVCTNPKGVITEMIKTTSIKINGELNNNLFNTNYY